MKWNNFAIYNKIKAIVKSEDKTKMMMNQQDIKVLLDVQKQFIEDLDDHSEERLAYIEDWVLTDSDPRVDPEEQKKIVDIDTKKLPLSTQLEANFARLYANEGVKTCASALYHGRLSDD